jgi:hypothetical protein
MSNTINKIHYALEIDTGGTVDIPSIGLYNGVFRYVTDDYDTSSATYEDTTPVTGTWERDLLKKNGVQIPSQKIDIVTGGDYAFLSSVNFTLVNVNEMHKTISNTADLYIIGATIKVYVVIDDVFYSRGVVSVSEYKFDDTTFTFMGKDKHNSDNSTVKDASFGYGDTELSLVIEDETAFLEEQFIKMIHPRDNKVVWNDNSFDTTSGDMPVSESGRYVGFARGEHGLVHTDDEHYIYITGHKNITNNMFLTFGSSDELHKIQIVDTGSFTSDTGTTLYTRMLISNIGSEIQDFTQFYGEQPSSVSQTVKDNTKIADSELVTVSIFKKGLSYKVPNGATVYQQDGKYIATDRDNNTVLLDGYIDELGNLVVETTEYTVSKLPTVAREEVLGWRDTYIRDQLEAGTMTDVGSRGSSISLPNDFGETGSFRVPEFGKYFYYYLDFGEDISDYKIGFVLSGLVDSRENWTTSRPESSEGLISLSPAYTGIDPEYRTEYNSQYLNTADLNNYSFFSNWDITSYKIVTDEERGDIPFLDASLQIPNVRRNESDIVLSGTVDVYTKDIMSFVVKSALCTNLPESSILSNDRVVSTEKGIINWVDSLESGYLYPSGKIAEFSNTDSDSDSSGKVMIQIVPFGSNNLGEWDINVGDENIYDDGATRYQSGHGGLFGINTICAYKTIEITTSTELKFKTINSSNTDYETVIKQLSGSSSDLSSRSSWYVGNEVTDEENTFNIVTKLCKQGFVAGFTDRTGSVVLKDFLVASGGAVTHNNSIIKDKTLKGFSLSDLSKCYNEFTIKFHRIGSTYQKELGVYNVDADSFPAIGEGGDNWQPPIDTGASLYRADTLESLQRVGIPNGDTTGVLQALTDDSRPKYRITLDGGDTIEFITPVYENTTASKTYFYFTRTGGSYVWNSGDILDVDTMEYNTDEILWKTFIVGVNSYADAKDIWELAHQSWMINKRIRKAPTERTELEWAVDLDTFYDTTVYDETVEYAYNYFTTLVEWTTRQKLQVSYDLPITVDTIKLNIVDNVLFNDAIILPNPAEFGQGWLTSVGVDTKNDVIKCGITFEPSFFAPPMPEQIDDIIETGSNVDDIIETGSNVDDIIEGN